MPYEKGNGKTVVIALGGNALGNTPQEQLTLVRNTAKHLGDMIEVGTTVTEDAGRGWRQVVASPLPKRIAEFDAVRDLVEDGYVVVSTGGGGVPVFETGDGYVGTPAVIDKDRSSALMAAELGAAGCRCSRPGTATWAPPRSSTRTAPAPSWPPSSAPTC